MHRVDARAQMARAGLGDGKLVPGCSGWLKELLCAVPDLHSWIRIAVDRHPREKGNKKQRGRESRRSSGKEGRKGTILFSLHLETDVLNIPSSEG